MLTLTLRSSIDGRFLARLVEQNSNVFVLDFGDRRVIDDATQRIHRGFTVFRGGQLLRAAPRDTALLVMLADYYAAEGLLVSLEEPLWPNRERSLEDILADRTEDSLAELTSDGLSKLADLDEETQDLPTDVWGRDEAEAVKQMIGESRERAVRATWSPPSALGERAPLDPMDAPESTMAADPPTVEMDRGGPELDGPPTLLNDEDDRTEVVPHPRRGPGGGTKGDPR